MPNGEEGQDAQIMIDPAQMAGAWANFARVSHSEHEFTLDFVRLDFGMQPLQGVVVSRVSVSPLFVTQLIDALQENWANYAAKAMPREVRDADHDDETPE
jgi:hypothetical protein